MPVQKTESRIPANFQPSGLGHSALSGDGKCALVSFVTSPLVVERQNHYVVFVTDAALVTAVETFEWSFSENGAAPTVQTTEIAGAKDSTSPGIGSPEVAREPVNDHSPYYQDVTLQTPESGGFFQRCVYSMTCNGALRRTPAQRKAHLDQLAASINGQDTDFRMAAAQGAGLCHEPDLDQDCRSAWSNAHIIRLAYAAHCVGKPVRADEVA